MRKDLLLVLEYAHYDQCDLGLNVRHVCQSFYRYMPASKRRVLSKKISVLYTLDKRVPHSARSYLRCVINLWSWHIASSDILANNRNVKKERERSLFTKVLCCCCYSNIIFGIQAKLYKPRSFVRIEECRASVFLSFLYKNLQLLKILLIILLALDIRAINI